MNDVLVWIAIVALLLMLSNQKARLGRLEGQIEQDRIAAKRKTDATEALFSAVSKHKGVGDAMMEYCRAHNIDYPGCLDMKDANIAGEDAVYILGFADSLLVNLTRRTVSRASPAWRLNGLSAVEWITGRKDVEQ
ncbi:MAG: hypothetical protein H0U23_00190 [Blastocatellia bacterium]|nr:hypothetical protein [Blastocatellia bacterium]